ncbi:isoleucine--tRNA ligase [Pseudoclavibacter endophyticus]|uniref:Isoleucine--tRNA ligase n=1 Tax=Pseudoclavibacter endophyticus TaxID=1778590 RepID=A0A6H9WAN8_9MICO|nr:isoleucine--tRNA ligase [Pseudoclavibacter endophyticus]KAB1646794.1 isoleucine--tRNA ligase [Pseudoclavibacter endophyticus]GGA75493.1 isoleucine--tRNA ligase [Pseudoclavibacter endophyticus]
MTYPRATGPADERAAIDRASSFGPAASVPASPSFPELEREVLEYWRHDGTFQASIDQRDGADEWVFYDGPPFANGLPHYGHLLTGYAKDVFPRFFTMRGKQVQREFGWDTHGLPAELEAMRQLGIQSKDEIERMGIGAFNAAARDSVLRYMDEWQDYVTRQARWVDFENGYKTLDLTYMESVIWAFKRLYDEGLAYEGFRVLPYCWRDETPLSNHELRMDDDVYQPRQDQTVTVTFPLEGERAVELGLEGVHALAWTTTPWTLPTNAALAVGPAIEYAVVPAGPNGAGDGADSGTRAYLLATERVGAHARELGYDDAETALAAVDRRIAGAELEDVRYAPLWDFFAGDEYGMLGVAWRILVADYVTTADGTGIVHQAPAYGEDDKAICDAAGIPTVLSVNDGGVFLDAVAPVAGLQVFDANKPLTRLLKTDGRLFKQASYEHSYPHCWRCRNPLIYKAVSSWFVRVTDIKDDLIRHNEAIEWVPENVKHGQFGKWLEGARDWSVSRNRYWGSPIPVWKSDDPNHPRIDVYGSLDELERDFGVRPSDLHRPAIDELTRPNPDDPTGRSTMRRIEDVFDVWFDSGSMPYAQRHYPFENGEWFDAHSPADFIVEYIGQTRGWFYVMHVLSVALFDRPAFSRVVSHGIVLGSDGRKMSKSLRNYPDVHEVFERDGSDAMRWFLMSSPVLRGGNLVVTEEGIREGLRQFLLPLWSTYYFFTTYANVAHAGSEPYVARWRTDSADPLDRYILAKTGRLVDEVAADLESLDSTTATQRLRDFADVLTNWYVRRSRDRFWGGVEPAGADGPGADDPGATESASVVSSGTAAFDTLFTVLETLTRAAAPLAPLVTESVWRGLTGGRSVHLEDWPDASAFPAADDLESAMDGVRSVSSAALALRKQAQLRVRLPLASMTVVTPDVEGLRPFADILRDELNVKAVVFEPLSDAVVASYGIEHVLQVNARAAGPRLGKRVQQAIKASKTGDWSEADGVVTAGGIPLEPGEYEVKLMTGDAADDRALTLLGDGSILALDTRVTPELAAEGTARDVIRAVQEARKEAGLDVSDRIRLALRTDDASLAAITAHSRLIGDETLAVALDIAGGLEPENDAAEHSFGALDVELEVAT